MGFGRRVAQDWVMSGFGSGSIYSILTTFLVLISQPGSKYVPAVELVLTQEDSAAYELNLW